MLGWATFFIKKCVVIPSFLIVRLIGLEPTRRKTLDPKSSASTNFATSAYKCKGNTFF